MDKEDICNRIVLSHKKKHFYVEVWMNLESVIQCEVSQNEEKQILYINTYI